MLFLIGVLWIILNNFMLLATFVGMPLAFIYGDEEGFLQFTMALLISKLVLLGLMRTVPKAQAPFVDYLQTPTLAVVTYLSPYIPSILLTFLATGLNAVFPLEALLFVIAAHMISLKLFEMMDHEETEGVAKTVILGGSICSCVASVCVLVFLFTHCEVSASSGLFIGCSLSAALGLLVSSIYVDEGILLDPSLLLLYTSLVCWCLVDDMERVDDTSGDFSWSLTGPLKFFLGFSVDRSLLNIAIFVVRLLSLYVFGTELWRTGTDEDEADETVVGRFAGDISVVLLYANLLQGLFNPSLVGNWMVRVLQNVVALGFYSIILFMPDGIEADVWKVD
ncbi:hypothetical protein SARC_06121 [Sphaeroforma arctica JP610]|uniref:Uncharacterized protein n=1 Tax=Sphaeroforma arctica JP610 TaxID=667725 RepID=A0A0L0FY73_9EUKA|nr:hypothetical protein SARC_06121 [Sphaeroforma arctica JP610]KNC81564.1 hypothetical protein SARC_06121 [Sphaeroforma arctica JP610]|eukprot:XP_014155466.1 hypothetical protein SARC_06121 [Sphaeroforma arctica JP610]